MSAIRRHWTSDAVRALIEKTPGHWPRYELIDGELVVTPAPAVRHQSVVVELWALLASYLERERLGIAFVSPADLELRAGSITQPDVFVVPAGGAASTGGEIRWGDVRSLILAIEVISPGSIRMDRVVKRDYYLDAGVPDYLIVDADARVVEHWQAGMATPAILREHFNWHPAGAAEPLVIALPALFDRIDAQYALLTGQLPQSRILQERSGE